MNFSKKYILSRNDYNKVVEMIKNEHKFNLSQYAYSITKRRIQNFFALQNIENLDALLTALKKSTIWNELFNFLQIPTTEMFRDFEVWVTLKYKLFSKFLNKEQIKIWLPNVTSDDELLSLLILLSETGLIANTEVTITSEFEKADDLIRNYNIKEKKFLSSKHNYLAYQPKANFDKYFDIDLPNVSLKKDLFRNVVFKKFSFTQNFDLGENFDFILFRNKMLYYGPLLQKKALDIIYNSLKIKGYLAIGIKETLQNWSMQNKFSLIEKYTNIYQKKR